MSQEIREQLSALMDGELSAEETRFLMRRLEHDQTLVSGWSSFHLARQALRRQEIVLIGPNFADGVLARMEDSELPVSRRSGSILRWASGGAIAASVAVAALVLSGPQDPTLGPTSDQTALTSSTVLPATPDSSTVAPVVTRSADFRPPMISPVLDVQPASASTAGFSTQPMPIDPRTQSYLVRHYDAAGNNGQSGMLPYVLLIVPSSSQAAAVQPEKATEQR